MIIMATDDVGYLMKRGAKERVSVTRFRKQHMM